jgi:PKHD-type hydroxylase
MHRNLYWIYPKAIPHRLCDDIIKFGLSQPNEMGITGQKLPSEITNKDIKIIKKKRRSQVTWLNDPWLYLEIKNWLKDANKNAGWNYSIEGFEKFQFTKYGLNEMYDWHCDGFNDSFSSGELKGLTRKISLTLTLSDPKEYEGGDLQFKLRNTEKDKITFIKETREKGTLVFFPSFVWHRVTPVISGTRYSLVLWSSGRPFI